MKHYSDIILAPVITEKSVAAKSAGVYTFKVIKSASKDQIKKAIEQAFGVKVKSVNTLNVKPKKKRVGRYSGKTKAYKKAIITLQDGFSIEI